MLLEQTVYNEFDVERVASSVIQRDTGESTGVFDTAPKQPPRLLQLSADSLPL